METVKVMKEVEVTLPEEKDPARFTIGQNSKGEWTCESPRGSWCLLEKLAGADAGKWAAFIHKVMTEHERKELMGQEKR